MPLELLTDINPETEALKASKARQVRVQQTATARRSTREARAHCMLGGLREGQELHVASMGELSLHDVAESIARYYGPFKVLTLATWAASEGPIKRLLALREAGRIGRLEALVDSRMPTDLPDAHALLKLSFDLYAPGANHAKVLAFTGGRCGVLVLSSANLTHNPRCEFMSVSMSSGLAAFHRDWIREVIRGQ